MKFSQKWFFFLMVTIVLGIIFHSARTFADQCEMFAVSSGELSPIGIGFPQDFTVFSLPLAVGDVAFYFTASGDFSSTTEYIDVEMDNAFLGRAFQFGGEDCANPPGEDSIIAPDWAYNDIILAGHSPFEVLMNPSVPVDPFICEGDTFVTLTISYATGNSCHADINQDCVVDTSDLGILLESWGPQDLPHPADVTGDHTVNALDLAVILGNWGPCPL